MGSLEFNDSENNKIIMNQCLENNQKINIYQFLIMLAD